MVSTAMPPHHLKPGLLQRRKELRSDANVVFVEPGEFTSLAISHRKLIRKDDETGRLRGLADRQTGKVYFTEEERLFA